MRQEAPLRSKVGDWACIFVEMGGSYREPIEKAEVHNEFILSHYIQEEPESIQKEGLLPQYGYLSELVMEQRSAIYLFKELDEVRYAMENWFGECIRYVYAPKT